MLAVACGCGRFTPTSPPQPHRRRSPRVAGCPESLEERSHVQCATVSKEVALMMQNLSRFQETVRLDELDATVVNEGVSRTVSSSVTLFAGDHIPGQDKVEFIKSQQASLSKDRERMIQGIQEQPRDAADRHSGAVYSALNGFGEEDVDITTADSGTVAWNMGPSASVQFGPSTSFSEVGMQITGSFSLNRRQSIAFRLLCRHLDRVKRRERGLPQLCMFIGGEGGTGKSRIIEALVELFASRGMSHRLLVTATSGTAAARINGITIHSACNFSKDMSRSGSNGGSGQIPTPRAGGLRVDGRVRMDWREKDVLVIDEVSMLGARTLYAVNERICELCGCPEDFGNRPVIVFLGDFHQFRPVQERSILLPSSEFPWDQGDVDLLNSTCYREGRRIPWESGITVVTSLNRNWWNLNTEATLSFQRQKQAQLRIFISEHKWKDGQPTEEEALMILSYGDDSSIPIPAVFMFVTGMPVIVNQNTHQGLKLVNGASYTALDIIVDKAYPGHRVSVNTILHFGPPAGILLTGESTKEFHFVGMPAGTILLTPISSRLDCQRKRPWQKTAVSRRGLPCAPAFACTDYKELESGM